MRLDRDSIQSMRTLVLMAIRLLSVLLIVTGLVTIGNRLVWAILAVGDLKQAWGVWNSIGAWHGIYLGLPMVLVGAALGGRVQRLHGGPSGPRRGDVRRAGIPMWMRMGDAPSVGIGKLSV